MKLEQINSVYLIGVGGIGMSALARYFNSLGKTVGGYDKTKKPLTEKLEEEGIAIHYSDDITLVREEFKDTTSTLIIYTPAIPGSHSELNFFMENGYEVLKRSQVLGLISESMYSVAVAGTHGKTTISSMIAHVLNSSTIGCNAFLGGIAKNFESNLVLNKRTQVVVLEADEYDRSFLFLHPSLAVVSAIDADHLDIYGDKNIVEQGFQEFISQVKDAGMLFIKKEINLDIPSSKFQVRNYSVEGPSDYFAKNFYLEEGLYVFDLVTPNGTIQRLKLGIPGMVNVENAIAASAISIQLGVTHLELKEALETFAGIERRFDYQIKTKELVYIDDYAHHPEELKATIESVRKIYPKKKITGIFQPHLYTRTRDFAKEFAQSLDLLDEIYLLDIYPAREEPISGVTSEIIFREITSSNKTLCNKEELLDRIEKIKPEVILTMGAGDIDELVKPIKEKLLK